MNSDEEAQFAKDGYVVLPGRIDLAVLDAFVRSADAALEGAQRGDGVPSRSLNLAESDVFDALHASALWAELHDFVAPAALEHFDGVAQLTVNAPPNDTAPSQPHIDHHRKGATKPDSFSLLIAVLLTDQPRPNEGNVWVWPGTHTLHAEFLDAYGPHALLESAGKLRQAAPAVHLPRPVSVCGHKGDVVVLHPLLGHDTGPNWGGHLRMAIYFRLRRDDHESRWQRCLTDPFLEYNLTIDAGKPN